MNRQELKVVGASAVGTAFEWYDFFLYGALVPVIGSRFFSDYGTAAQTVFALLTFAAGFIVRPIGALVFARITDLVGRKIVFLMTLVLMGTSTVVVGLLPTADEIGILAPILLVTCRILQGLAVSGEFGAAVTYVSSTPSRGSARTSSAGSPAPRLSPSVCRWACNCWCRPSWARTRSRSGAGGCRSSSPSCRSRFPCGSAPS